MDQGKLIAKAAKIYWKHLVKRLEELKEMEDNSNREKGDADTSTIIKKKIGFKAK